MNTTLQTEHNPALDDVAALAGDWDMEISNAAFLPDPADKVSRPVSFEWLENGAYLLLRMGAEALWLIGRDDTSLVYTVLYFDARKVSRIYQMSYSGNLWKMWRDTPEFSQRYEARLSPDGNTITATWEKASDGNDWEHDFDVTFRRK